MTHVRHVFLTGRRVDELPEYARKRYEIDASATADINECINYYFLDKSVSLWAKFFGLFSKKRKEEEISGDLVKTINEETLHQVIEMACPGLNSPQHHSIISELRNLFFDQYHWHDSLFSDKARKMLYTKVT